MSGQDKAKVKKELNWQTFVRKQHQKSLKTWQECLIKKTGGEAGLQG